MNKLLIALCLLLVACSSWFAWDSSVDARQAAERAARAEAEVMRLSTAGSSSPPITRQDSVGTPIADPVSIRREAEGDATSAPGLAELSERLARLEDDVRELGVRVDGRPPPESFTTPEAIAKELRGLGSDPRERPNRIALLERFLSLFPDHPEAQARLEELIGEHLMGNPQSALDVLDRFGARAVTDPLTLDGIRANVLVQNQRFDEGRACYERLRLAATDHEGAASASFWIAHSYMSEGRYDQAQAGFEALIARYGLDPSQGMASLVNGAKNQLELIARYRQH